MNEEDLSIITSIFLAVILFVVGLAMIGIWFLAIGWLIPVLLACAFYFATSPKQHGEKY